MWRKRVTRKRLLPFTGTRYLTRCPTLPCSSKSTPARDSLFCVLCLLFLCSITRPTVLVTVSLWFVVYIVSTPPAPSRTRLMATNFDDDGSALLKRGAWYDILRPILSAYICAKCCVNAVPSLPRANATVPEWFFSTLFIARPIVIIPGPCQVCVLLCVWWGVICMRSNFLPHLITHVRSVL